jgi:mono/diheme cytochrome c family protein
MFIVKIAFTLTAATGICLAAGDAKAGQTVYNTACKSCHGADGTPNPNVAKMMKVEMRHLGDKAVQALTDAQWKAAIVEGIGKMKPVKSINAKQVDDCIAFSRTLKK